MKLPLCEGTAYLALSFFEKTAFLPIFEEDVIGYSGILYSFSVLRSFADAGFILTAAPPPC